MATTAQCPPINTARLGPVKQRLGKIFIEVSENGQVILAVKSRGAQSCDNSQCDITKKLIRISSDGMQIEVYNGVEEARSSVWDLMSSQPGQVYCYPDMPERIWKKYHHAYKFVEVIKSVTPKVTLVTDRARCKLMENSPTANFQACFHNGVTLLFNKMKVTLTESDGSSLTFHEDQASSHVSPDTVALVEYSLKCRDQCSKIEKTVSSLQSRNLHQDLFPVFIGTNNQSYLPQQNQNRQLPMNEETGNRSIGRSSLRTAILNQEYILQPQNNVHTGADYGQKDAGSKQSQNQIQSSTNVFHCDINECPHPQDSRYPSSDESYFKANVPLESSGVQNSHQGLKLKSAYSIEETQGCLQGHSASSEDFGDSNGSYYYSRIQSGRFNRALSLHLDNSGIKCTDLSPDALKPIALAKTTNSEDNLPDWQSLSENVPNTCLAKQFQAECKIPESCYDSYLLSENNHLRCSPPCQTHFCNNTNSQPGKFTCFTNMPDSRTTQFQNPFLTPQKSQIPCDSFRYPCSGEIMKCRHKTPVRCDIKVDERQLKNVKRNLCFDTASEEIKSFPTSPNNILMHGMINFSDCNSSANLVYQNTELQNISQSSSLNNVLLQTGMSVESSLPTMTPQLSPAKASHVTKSILRFSPYSHTPAADSLPGSMASPSYSDTSSVYNCTQSVDLSITFSEDTDSTEHSDIINAHSFDKPVTHDQFGRPSPEYNTSPKKSTPLRKVASLSPHKTCSIQMNPAECVEQMSGDVLTFQYQASPVTNNRCGLRDSTESNLNNYQSGQFLENCASPLPNTSQLNKPVSRSYPGTPLCKDFPCTLPSSHKWNGIDLPLSRHTRRSSDMSSDGRSSSPLSSTSDVICQVFVPYVGWASLYAAGTVWVLYNDGTQLGVKPTEATITYVGQDGHRARYIKTDAVPEIVKIKLEKLPKVIDLIMKSQETGISGVQLCS